MVKVARTAAGAALGRAGKAKRTGDGSFKVTLGDPAPAAGAAGPSSAAGPVASAQALLAVQEVGDATAGRSKGLMRAEDMLDALEDLRRGLLMGTVSKAKLQSLARMARARRETIDDPRLNALLDEIELRAEVELAKLEFGG